MPCKDREDRRTYMKKWKKKNKAHCREYSREYNKSERGKARSERWLERNEEEQRIHRGRHYRENRGRLLKYRRGYLKTERGRASSQRAGVARRAREKEIVNTLTAQEWSNILKEYNYKCAYCGVGFNKDILPTRDHIIPISKGGSNTKNNVIPACQPCNSRKFNRIIKGVP